MRSVPIASLRAAAVVAVLWTSGCSNQGEPNSSSVPVAPPPTVASASPDAGPLPAPEALTDVMYRLADIAVPGIDKIQLVQNALPTQAATLDNFAAALRDGGFTPVTFSASEIRWSDTAPGDALATIKVTTTNPANPGEFTFPMEFRPTGGGWQLSRGTADMLLAFGYARNGAIPGTSTAAVPPR